MFKAKKVKMRYTVHGCTTFIEEYINNTNTTLIEKEYLH